jgi:hypothetical protein
MILLQGLVKRVVLDADDAAGARADSREELRVERLREARVDHARVDAARGELVGRRERGTHRFADRDQRHVCAVAQELPAPERDRLRVGIESAAGGGTAREAQGERVAALDARREQVLELVLVARRNGSRASSPFDPRRGRGNR